MPEKLERCVDQVKGQKGIENAYAICNASIDKTKEEKIEETIMKQVLETKLSGCGCNKKKIS